MYPWIKNKLSSYWRGDSEESSIKLFFRNGLAFFEGFSVTLPAVFALDLWAGLFQAEEGVPDAEAARTTPSTIMLFAFLYTAGLSAIPLQRALDSRIRIAYRSLSALETLFTYFKAFNRGVGAPLIFSLTHHFLLQNFQKIGGGGALIWGTIAVSTLFGANQVHEEHLALSLPNDLDTPLMS